MKIFKKYAFSCDKLGMGEKPTHFENVKNAKVKTLMSVITIHKKNERSKIDTSHNRFRDTLDKKQRSANGYSNCLQ